MTDGRANSGSPGARWGPGAAFADTPWTTLLKAQESSPAAQAALNELCRRYWPPVYAFIRRRWTQHSPQQAEDLTQGFFAEFIRKFPELDLKESQGRFRSYLLACLTRFLLKDWSRSKSAREVVISPELMERTVLDTAWLGEMECAPEKAFDLAWATRVADTALAVLRDEYTRAGKERLHVRLVPLLTARASEGTYEAIARELNTSEGALRVAAHQLRRRFGQLLRAEVAQTVAHPQDTDDELRYLLALWGQARDCTAG